MEESINHYGQRVKRDATMYLRLYEGRHGTTLEVNITNTLEWCYYYGPEAITLFNNA